MKDKLYMADLWMTLLENLIIGTEIMNSQAFDPHYYNCDVNSLKSKGIEYCWYNILQLKVKWNWSCDSLLLSIVT